MKRQNRNKLSLYCFLFFSTIISATIFVGLLISGARGDSENFIVQRDASQPIALNQYNANVYVLNLRDNTLSIISGQTKTVIGTHNVVSKYPTILTFASPSSRNTYVVNLHDNTLSIISGQTKTVIGNTVFVSNVAEGTTFSHFKSYNLAASHKVFSSSAVSTKAFSNLATKTASTSSSSLQAVANSTSKAVTTPLHPPMIP